MNTLLGVATPKERPASCCGGVLSPDTAINNGCQTKVLLKENYLSEFATKSERRKVLENLGINSSIDWGEVGGYIESQQDLMKWLERYIEEGDAEQLRRIPYSNAAYPGVETLYDAINMALYRKPQMEASITPESGTVGYTIGKYTISWAYDKPNIVRQTINGEEIDPALREYTGENLSSDTSWTITGNDGTNEVSTKVSIRFYYEVFCGVGTVLEESFEEQQCAGWTDLESEFTVDAGESQYIWILVSSRYDNPTFTVGGVSGGFVNADTIDIYNREFYVWRSDNPGLGLTTIKIS